MAAISLAKQGEGRTAPNPMVGAVIVRDGTVLAEGWHRIVGDKHAEVDALDRLDDSGVGATMYVNLEPCCHFGLTPPCTDALLASGIRRVVVGMIDPDPRIRGNGVEKLRQHGLEVDVGVAEAECRELNAAYLCAARHKRPFVVLKAAVTLDGRIASAAGDSQWITGPLARQEGHVLRNTMDAVVVGSGTLLADDPSLNTRLPGGRNALPVVLDSHLRCPQDAKVLTAGRRPVVFCGSDAVDRGLQADIVRVTTNSKAQLELNEVLSHLYDRGIHSVLIEGGGQVHRSFLDAGLVDRIELFVAPKVLAGGPTWVGGTPFDLDNAPGFRVVKTRVLGEDIQVTLGVFDGECGAE